MINWSTLIKTLMQTYIVIVSGSVLNVSTVHLNGIWHLIWRTRCLLKPVLGGHPVLSGQYSIPRGCPLNTGFTVSYSLVKISVLCLISSYVNFTRSLPGDISKSRNIDKEIKLEVSLGVLFCLIVRAKSEKQRARERVSLCESLSVTSQLTVKSSIDRGENAWGLGWACADSQFSVTSMLELHQPGSRKTSIERALKAKATAARTSKHNWFLSKTAMYGHHAFFVRTFLWCPLHNYDVKIANATFYGGSENTTQNFSSSFWTSIQFLLELNSRKIPPPKKKKKKWKI